jgi:hypothetical protein
VKKTGYGISSKETGRFVHIDTAAFPIGVAAVLLHILNFCIDLSFAYSSSNHRIFSSTEMSSLLAVVSVTSSVFAPP